MKTGLLIVGMLILAQAAQATAQVTVPSPNEIPADVIQAALAQAPGNWAKKAIELVVSRGLVVGYPNRTFDWRSSATRAEVAQIFARLFERYPLDQLGKFLTQSDLTLLENGLRETRDGLVALKTQSTEQAQKSEELINGLQGQLSTLDGKLSSLTEQVDGRDGDLDSRLSAVSESLDVLSGNLDEFRQSTLLLEGVPEKQETLEARLTQLEQKQGETNTTLGKDIAELGNTAVSIQGTVSKISEDLGKQVEQFKDIQKDTTQLQDTISDLGDTQTEIVS